MCAGLVERIQRNGVAVRLSSVVLAALPLVQGGGKQQAKIRDGEIAGSRRLPQQLQSLRVMIPQHLHSAEMENSLHVQTDRA